MFLDVPRAGLAESSAFWSAITGWAPSASRGEEDQFLTLVPAAGPSWVKLQGIDGGPRVHLDLDVVDRDAMVERAVTLGAAPAWQYADVPVLRSPGGILLCVTLAQAGPRMVRSGPSLLDQVCLDVPARAWEGEVAFWSALLGREAQQGALPELVRLADPDPAGAVRVLMQRVADDRDTVGAHVDLAVTDRTAETARHLGLGAALVAEHGFWSVLRAPDGHVYCLTDRDPLTGTL